MAPTALTLRTRQALLVARPHARTQQGVYALEWAIIFPVFFILLYAIISYGLTFLVRESMQYAVEEGARAALRYPSSSVLTGGASPTWQHRRIQAQNTTAEALAWLPANLRPVPADIRFHVCHLGTTDCTNHSAFNPNIICNTTTPCMVVVGYGVTDYRSHAIAPAIPGLGLMLPATLQANASIMVDRGVL